MEDQGPRHSQERVRVAVQCACCVCAASGMNYGWVDGLQPLLLSLCRYEYEENPEVCHAMEHTAECFINNQWEHEEGGTAPVVEPEAEKKEEAVASGGPVGSGWAS